MRGQYNLFNDLIATAEKEKSDRGRNRLLSRSRDEWIASRYYFYVYLHHLNYERTLREMETEFCISKIRIVEVLQDKMKEFIKELRANDTNIRILRKKYPSMVWDNSLNLKS